MDVELSQAAVSLAGTCHGCFVLVSLFPGKERHVFRCFQIRQYEKSLGVAESLDYLFLKSNMTVTSYEVVVNECD